MNYLVNFKRALVFSVRKQSKAGLVGKIGTFFSLSVGPEKNNILLGKKQYLSVGIGNIFADNSVNSTFTDVIT